ncbi:MAG: hypothetical protein K2H83_05100 [Duncaniella sp.]|nr:hypothetical protein [Duncaniella sp.]
MKTFSNFILPLFAGFGLMAGLTGCQNDGEDNFVESAPIELTQAESRSVGRQNNFGFKVLLKVEEKGNFALSPLSMNYALSMAANGAAGESLAELLGLLGAEDLEALNRVNEKMLEYLPAADQNVIFGTANALFAIEKAGLYPAYGDMLSRRYMADVYSAEANAGEMEAHINGYIADKTGGAISKGVGTLDDHALWASVNTLCFKGAWANKFDRSKTAKADFANYDGTVSEADMMHLSAEASKKAVYVANDVLEGVRMDFGNGRFSMTAAMPKDGAGIEAGLESLAGGDLPHDVPAMLLSVAMPRFTVESFEDVAEPLQALGVRTPFDIEKAEFPNICATPSRIGHVYSAVRIEVNEEGSEAKASNVVTGVDIMPEPRSLTFDSPFVFYITEASSGAVVFAGKVTKL